MKTGSDEAMWSRITDAARENAPLQYQEIYRAVIDGKIKAKQQGAAWLVWRPDVEQLAAERAALKGRVIAPDLGGPAAEVLEETIANYSRALIAVKVCDLGMLADEAEARVAGNPDLADAIATARDHLRSAEVRWNGSSWTMTVPGVGSATTRPAAPAEQAEV